MTTRDAALQKITEGHELLNRDYIEGALRAFTEAIKFYPELPEAYEARALAYDRLNRNSEAEADRSKADSIRDVREKAVAPKGYSKYVAISAAPIALLSLISTGGAVHPFWYALWYVAAAYGVLVLFSAIISYFAGERRQGAGLLAGLSVGIISLGATCFANLSTLDI
jgi:tetratricopeptide (TPR) repeat protein